MLILKCPGTLVPHFSAIILTLWSLKQTQGMDLPRQEAEAGQSAGFKEENRPGLSGRMFFCGEERWMTTHTRSCEMRMQFELRWNQSLLTAFNQTLVTKVLRSSHPSLKPPRSI